MSGFKSIVSGLIIAIIGGLTVAIFQQPLTRYFIGAPLEAEFVSGPWAPFPKKVKSGVSLPVPEPELGPGEFNLIRDSNNSFARMTVRNVGDKTVDDIHIRLTSQSLPATVYAPLADGKHTLITDTRDIDLPSLRPGASYELLFWKASGFGYPMGLEMESFSSAGPIHISHFEHPEGGKYNRIERDILYDFLSDPLTVGIWTAISMLILMLGLIIFLGRDWGKLLTDDDYYLEQRIKHEKAAKK